MYRRSPGILLLSDEEHNRVVSVGLYLGMQHLAPRSNEGHHNNPKVLTPRLQARGALPDNLFNPYAEKIVKELGAAVVDALKEPLSDNAITQMLAECQ